MVALRNAAPELFQRIRELEMENKWFRERFEIMANPSFAHAQFLHTPQDYIDFALRALEQKP